MEETLGKRIAAHRKRLGLTQDRLAELLGVTAQAVSKWENDQSCPDINTLPKLAEIFGVTTDEMLGIPHQKVHAAELVAGERDEDEPEGIHTNHGNFELNLDMGHGGLGLALWVIVTGALLLLIQFDIFHTDAGLWEILWPTGLLLFGILGLVPKFSVFRLGCALFGGYFLLDALQVAPFVLGKELLLPVFLLLFGLALLLEATRKKKRRKNLFSWSAHTPHGCGIVSEYDIDGKTFTCSTCFGEDSHRPQMARISEADIEVSFGQLTVDLTACEEIANGCSIDVECSFGNLDLLIPRTCRVETDIEETFSNVEVTGSPNPDAAVVIELCCEVCFGNITIHYV